MSRRPWPRRAAAALLVAGAALSGLGGPPAAVGAALDLPVVSVDTTAHPDVRMLVAAPPAFGGRAVDPSAFSLTENGRAAAVTVQALPDEGMEVALVIDTSGSMQGAPLEAAKRNAKALLDRLPAPVPVTVIGFGATANVLVARSTDEAAQAAAVDRLRAGGETALYDAVAAAAGHLAASPTRRFLVLLSDGGDTVSRTPFDAVTAALAKERIGVLAVELRTAESNSDALRRLAATTSGTVVPANDPSALTGAFDAVSALLVRQYELRWRSGVEGPATIAVTITTPSLQAAGTRQLEFPTRAAPPATGPRPAPSGASPAAAPSATTDVPWVVWAGAGAVGLGLLVGGLCLLMPGTPRARGLSRRQATPRDALAGLTERAGAAASRMISREQESFLGALLERAGLDLRAGELLVLAGGLALGAFVLAWLAIGPVAGILAAVLVLAATKAGLELAAHRRRTAFANQLPDTLALMAGTLRAGYGLAQAVETATREAPSPTSEEFRRVVVEARLGRSLIDAMRSMALRIDSQDLEWVIQAFEIHADVGGDLADVLDTVAGTIRERTRIRRQVQVLSAEGVLSAIILFVLPLVMVLVLSITNPAYLGELTETTLGRYLVAAAIAFQLAGGVWLRRLVKPIY